jgi:hypothetical protein
MSYNFLRNPRIPGIHWHDTNSALDPTNYLTIPRLFGLDSKADRLPDEGIPARVIKGIKMWVDPKPVNLEPITSRHPSTHRAKAECPLCSKVVSIGRLHQHAKIHRS